MTVYKAPVDEMRFVLNEVLGYEENVTSLKGYEDATTDLVHAILQEAARLCENELQPLNLTGDEEGCHYENGVVRTPGASRRPTTCLSKAAGRVLQMIRGMADKACPRSLASQWRR